jgi:hypothetical protein
MPRRWPVALAIALVPTMACSLLTPPFTLSTLPPASLATQALPPASTPTAAPQSTSSTPWPTPEANLADDGLQAPAMLPAFAGDIARVHVATRYAIDVRVSLDAVAQQAHLEGAERLRFTNPLRVSLADIVLMLWPNDSQYLAHMQAGPAVIDGVAVTGEPELDGVAQRFRLSKPLGPGQTLDLSLPFSIDARGPIGGPDPRRFGISEGMLAAPTFYPLVPRLAPDGTWLAEKAPPGGDTTNSDSAYYQVSMTSDASLGIATTGSEVSRQAHADGTQTVTCVTGPVRDFAFALGPFAKKSQTVDGVIVTAWTLPEHQGDLAKMLTTAAAQLQELDRLVGTYPYAELDIIDAPGAFGGIEYPGLVFIGTVGSLNLVIPTVHEVAHQWFYGLIGDDQIHQPWLDEAAATYAEILYYESAGQSTEATGLLSRFREWLRMSPSAVKPIGLGVGDYASEDEYSLIVYVKGALFFDALRSRLGDKTFDSFLQAYFQDYRYGSATSADFQREAEHVCACGLQSMFDLWVYKGGPVPELQ